MKKFLLAELAAVFCIGLLSAAVPSGNSITMPQSSNVGILSKMKTKNPSNVKMDAKDKRIFTKEDGFQNQSPRVNFTKEDLKKQRASKKLNIVKGAKIDSDKALFIMEVGNGLGSAVQALFFDKNKIDSTNESSNALYYVFLDSSENQIDQLYSEALVKVPSNAIRTLSDQSKGILDYSASMVEVTPGSYDMVVLEIDSAYYYPLLLEMGKTLRGAVPQYLLDNTTLESIGFIFEAGFVYHFVYDYSFGSNPLSFYSPYEPYTSVTVSDINVANSSATLSAAEPVKVIIDNTGMNDISGINFYLSVNGKDAVKESMPLTDTVRPFASYEYQFTETADLSAEGIHNIKVWIDAIDGDVVKEDDTLSIRRLHSAPVSSYPWLDTVDGTLINWNVIDLNGGSYWMAEQGNLIDANGSMDGWAAIYYYDETRPGDDYLVSVAPFVMEKDSSYRLEFMVANSGYVEYPEKFSIYYGTSSDPLQMTQIWSEKEIKSGFYTKAIANIANVPADGSYYIAIKAASDANMYALIVDNIKVEKGTASASSKLSVEDVSFAVLPTCILPSDASATAMLLNKGEYCNDGDGDVSSFTLKYKLNNNAEQTMSAGAIPAGGYTDLRIDKLDLSTKDSNILSVYLQDESDGVTASISVAAPVTSLPIYYDFTLPEDIAQFGPLDGTSWFVNQFWGFYISWYMIGENAPLVSKCFALKANTRYNVEYDYITGYDSTQSFYLAVGIAGTDWKTWTKIDEVLNSYEDFGASASETFTVPADGNYQFAFVAMNNDYLEIYTFGLDEATVEANEKITSTSTVKVTPNPVKDNATVSSLSSNIKDIVVTTSAGNIIYNAKGINAKTAKINTSSFTQGVYMVRVITEAGINTVKMLVVK